MFVQPYQRRIGVLAFGLWVTHPSGLIGANALRSGQVRMTSLTGRITMTNLSGEAKLA